MPLQIESVTEADLLPIIHLEYTAFCVASPLNSLLYPNGMTPAILAKALPMQQSDLANPDVVFKKVVDTSLPSELVALAQWRIIRFDQPPEKWDHDNATEYAEEVAAEVGYDHPDFNSKLFIQNSRGLDALRRRWTQGKARIHLAALCTAPQHQRRGAGKMLLDYGAELAEREALPTTILAIEFAVPLYTREGFKAPEEAVTELDLREWGADESHITRFMRKPAPATKKVLV